MVEGIFSEVQTFTYDSGRVALLSPGDGASVTVPTLRWAAATDAVNYKVEIRDNTDALAASATTSSLSWTPTGSTPLNPAKGPFSWTVQSMDYSGSVSPKYDGRTFSIDGIPEDTPCGVVDAVADTCRARGSRRCSGSRSPARRTTGSGSASGTSGTRRRSPILTTNYPYPAATDTGEQYLIPGTYIWQVQAFTVTGGTTASTDWGPIGTFEVTDLPTGHRSADRARRAGARRGHRVRR